MDEKEYQSGVWYGADVEPPNGSNFIVYVDIDPMQIMFNDADPKLQAFLKERNAFRKYDFAYTRNDRKFIFKNSIVKEYDPKNFRLLNWMIIPEPPEE